MKVDQELMELQVRRLGLICSLCNHITPLQVSTQSMWDSPNLLLYIRLLKSIEDNWDVLNLHCWTDVKASMNDLEFIHWIIDELDEVTKNQDMGFVRYERDVSKWDTFTLATIDRRSSQPCALLYNFKKDTSIIKIAQKLPHRTIIRQDCLFIYPLGNRVFDILKQENENAEHSK